MKSDFLNERTDLTLLISYGHKCSFYSLQKPFDPVAKFTELQKSVITQTNVEALCFSGKALRIK